MLELEQPLELSDIEAEELDFYNSPYDKSLMQAVLQKKL